MQEPELVEDAEDSCEARWVERRFRKDVSKSMLEPVTLETRKTGHIRSEVKLVALTTTSSLQRKATNIFFKYYIECQGVIWQILTPNWHYLRERHWLSRPLRQLLNLQDSEHLPRGENMSDFPKLHASGESVSLSPSFSEMSADGGIPLVDALDGAYGLVLRCPAGQFSNSGPSIPSLHV